MENGDFCTVQSVPCSTSLVQLRTFSKLDILLESQKQNRVAIHCGAVFVKLEKNLIEPKDHGYIVKM